MSKIKIDTNRWIQFLVFATTAKKLETLFALNYLWFAIVALLPPEVIYSSLFTYLDLYNARGIAACVFFIFFVCIIVGLYYNIRWLRQTMLTLSCGICLMYGGAILTGERRGAAAGFLLILAILASINAWRINYEVKDEG